MNRYLNAVSIVSRVRTWQVYRKESLHPPGHTMTDAAPRNTIKGTPAQFIMTKSKAIFTGTH